MDLKKLCLFLLISISFQLTGNLLHAQEINENNFTLYTKEQGLSHNIITGIAQDSIGYIWIATQSGLNRFNGSNFIQFHSSNDSLSIPSEQLNGLVPLDNYRLATYANGLHIIDTRTGNTRNLFIPYVDKQYQYKFNWILSVCGNAAGDIFILARSGFYHFDKDYRLVFRFDYYSREEVAVQSFGFGRYLVCLDDHSYAIVGIDGIYYYDFRKKLFKKMSAEDCPIMAAFLDYPKTDFQFFQQKPGSFFVMSTNENKLFYINPAENKKTITRLPFRALINEFDYRSELVSFNDTLLYITGSGSGFYEMKLNPQSGTINFNPKKYLPFYFCRHILQDRDHNFWIATNKGLFRQDNNRLHIQQVKMPASVETLFPDIVIDDVHVTGDKIFVATRGNGGLLEFDKRRLQFTRRISFIKNRPTADNVFAVAPAGPNSLLVGTNGPLFQLNTETDEKAALALEKWDSKSDWIADLYKDRKQNIWIAAGNLYKYESATGKLNMVSQSGEIFDKLQGPKLVKEDSSGNIWLAGHGLARYNVSTNSIDKFIDSFPYIKIPDKQVNSFTADQQNNLWISTNNNGLTCYNIEKGKFLHFIPDIGMTDNNISAMIIIGNKLWIAAYSGIACLDLHTFRITGFDKEDGFPDLPITKGAKFSYDTAQNKLYIGFSNTLVQFDPDIIYQNKQTPKLFIESIAAGEQHELLCPNTNISIPWQDNELTVTIGSINFYTGNSQRYAYRVIKDDNTAWQQLGAQNNFTVSNLSPGYHRIQVKLNSANNRWPEQVKEISIYVVRPFWKQEWFMALAVVFLLILVYLLLSWRTSYIRKNEQEKTHIEKLKADGYKNQFELEQISNYFSSSLAGKKNVEEVLWDVTKNLIGRMNYVDCIIYVWNADKTKMVQKAAYGPKGTPKAITSPIFDVSPGQGLVGHVMQTKEPLLVSDTRIDNRYRVDDMSRLSELCVPIIHDDELIGIIDSEHHFENHFKERDVKILTTIATLVGNKIKQIESEQSLEIKQKEIAFINQQLAEAQLSALQTQMNPHFIFNSLNSIKGMILDNEQQKASRYLSKFANMIRITLNQSKETFTTLYENIEHLQNYLLMEKLRFDDSFSFRIIVNQNIDKEETLIPTLMMQPLAENAIWHGLMNKKGKKNLVIRFSRKGETISCCIVDNGIGINQAEQSKKLNKPAHQPVGLSNLYNRIKIMNEKYNAGCTLTITDSSMTGKGNSGTCAVLRFNIITNKLLV